MYLILHAFSRRNAGDGLLVDLTLEALEAAGVARSECALLALDPESFPDFGTVFRAPGEPSARVSWKLFQAGLNLGVNLVSGGTVGSVPALVRRSKGLIAVGGGYLVADSLVRQAGVLLNHMTQLSSASRSDVPTVYLPQSIGPLDGIAGRMARNHLAGMDRVFVRDDKTMAELSLPNTRRIGDLAVLKLARQIEEISPVDPQGQTILVGRDLPNPDTYLENLDQLAEKLEAPRWAVQADTRGPRSDKAFYERRGYKDAEPFGTLLEAGVPGVVVSVRLHGAIAALLAGRPAIHLSYERKGWGAYEDLGIAEYVHDARSFDVDSVLRQVRVLQADPAEFWERIRSAAPSLKAQYQEMVTEMRSLLVPE